MTKSAWSQLKLRIPSSLKKRLEREAERKLHSLNAEVVYRIDLSFRLESKESLEARILALEKARYADE